jgi:hypothetical protein
LFGQVEHVPVEEIMRDIDKIFALVDYAEWLQFVGGEIFMRDDLWRVYAHCLRYKNSFGKLILITNATVLPCPQDISTMKKYGNGLQVQISDYGKYSHKIKQLESIFTSEGIPYVAKEYCGGTQHFGGWVDNTRFADRGKTEAEVAEQHKNCGQVAMRNYHLYRGHIQGCARSLLASALGKITPAERDYVDLNDDAKPIEEKRDIIRRFNDSPRVSCRSCVGFTEAAERFPAAEQL